MPAASPARDIAILRRILAYGRKVFALPEQLGTVSDQRPKPRIPTAHVVRSAVVMFLSRLGSLNALEQLRHSSSWLKWIGGAPPSADSLGRITGKLELDSIRSVQRQFYSRLKRIKAFRAPGHGLIALVIDGHESHSSHRQRCRGCLERRVQTKNGVKVEYYHRHVTAMLLGHGIQLLLDAEPQEAGENEVSAALRLMSRVCEHYPRAFDVILADALYTEPRFYKHVLGIGKHLVTVLKEN